MEPVLWIESAAERLNDYAVEEIDYGVGIRCAEREQKTFLLAVDVYGGERRGTVRDCYPAFADLNDQIVVVTCKTRDCYARAAGNIFSTVPKEF